MIGVAIFAPVLVALGWEGALPVAAMVESAVIATAASAADELITAVTVVRTAGPAAACAAVNCVEKAQTAAAAACEMGGGCAPGSGATTLGLGPGATTADLGNKLDYMLGKATGTAHNIDRSQQLLAQLQRIGLTGSSVEDMLRAHFDEVINDASNIVTTQANGFTVRESLLAGPAGFVKVESIWDGTRLITVNFFGG